MTKEEIIKRIDFLAPMLSEIGAWPEVLQAMEEYANQSKWIPHQLCPKCNGQGTVSKPSHIPGDVHQWSHPSMSFVCDVCNGTKIILMAQCLPQPPNQ